MNIYVGHSNDFDFKTHVYQPIRNSELNEKHNIVLPHEKSSKPFDTKSFLLDCDLFLAEVSYKSTGLGIEMGWANNMDVPIVCFYKEGSKPSSSIYVVAKNVIKYKNEYNFIKKLTALLM